MYTHTMYIINNIRKIIAKWITKAICAITHVTTFYVTTPVTNLPNIHKYKNSKDTQNNKN